MVLKIEYLSEELTRFCQLRQRFLERDGQIDDATFLAVLESVDQLRSAIAAAACSALEDESVASRLRGRMDQIEARIRRIDRRADDKREMALRAMREAGLERLQARGVRIELRRTPPTLIVGDEVRIPDEFRVTQPPRLNYQAIREALGAGADVPGAELSEPETYLSVRAD